MSSCFLSKVPNAIVLLGFCLNTRHFILDFYFLLSFLSAKGRKCRVIELEQYGNIGAFLF